MQQESPDAAFQRTQAQGAVPSPLSRSGEDHPLQTARSPSGKQKKRVRSESACEPVKQQRIDKQRSSEDTNASQAPETPSLVGRNGGLCSVASVDRLMCMMTYEWHDRMQRPVDLMASRTVFAKIITATVELDCLFRFLKLGGLSVVDRWLQEVYVGRPPTEKEDSPDWDRAAEDFLLAVLGALERLPVDLVSLKTCSVGKSVNHLRGHKHPDIQRRARKLIEMWKKRVESEMKQTGEARLSMEQNVSPQHLDGGSGGCYTHGGSHLESQAPFEHSDVGRGKYVSVSSLCSTPERQSRASSAITTPAFTANDSSKSSLKHSNDALVVIAAATPHPSDVFPRTAQDGQVTSSTCVPGPYTNQRRVARSAGVSRQGKSATLSVSNSSSDATAFSGSVWVSKDHIEGGSILDRSIQRPNPSSAAESCTLPCCNFFQKGSENTVACNLPCGSTLNSASSYAAEFKERELHHSKLTEQQLCSEPIKTSIQQLASLAVSANSTIDVKSPDSPSVRNMCFPSPTAISSGKKGPTEIISTNYSHQPSPAGNTPVEREHYDRNSSTVSSPSETSTPMDTSLCEIKRGITGYGVTPSPGDTTSETSLSSALGKKGSVRKRGASTSGMFQEHANVPLSSKGEAVGESCTVIKGDSEKRGYSLVKPALDNTVLKAASEATALPSRCSEDGPLDATRLLVVQAEQLGMTCKRTSYRGAIHDRNGAPCDENDAGSRGADALVMVGSKQSFSGSVSPSLIIKGNERDSTLTRSADLSKNTVEQKQVANDTASAIRELNRRPDFDLNEMLSGGEEGAVQASGTIAKSWAPMMDVALPALDSMHSLPIMPSAPVAVVAAAKGPFMLQAIACSRPPMGVLGWKGSAATSAFRPTQPRTVLQKGPLNVPEHSMNGKTILDFDLNIAAEPSSFVHDEIRNVDTAVRSSSMDVKGAVWEGAGGGTSCSMARKADGPPRTTWDLNQLDSEAVASIAKLDLDLNNGPTVQDCDDVVLAAKPIRLKDPLPSSSLAPSSRMPNHSLRPSAPPMVMPAFAMSNPEVPYAAGSAMPWVNGGSHDGLLQYNVFMQNPSGFASSGMACPPLSSVAAGPFQGLPYGFSPTPLQCFSASYGDSHGATPQSAAVYPALASTEPLLPSQMKPPYMMGMLTDAVHQQGMGGFWNRPNFDLNAGPEGVNVSNGKDDRRQMFIMNEQMRARPQAGGKAAAFQHREHEGCVGMPGSNQGVPLRQSLWH